LHFLLILRIFGATPVGTMHAFRQGVVEKVKKLVLSKVPASKGCI
jgi:hypothetical protein